MNGYLEGSAPPRAAEAKQFRTDRYGDPLPEGAMARLGTVRLRHRAPIGAAVFTPDSKTVIVSDSAGDIISWYVATGQRIRQYNSTDLSIAYPCLALSSDGKTLVSPAWAGEGGVHLWDVETGKQLAHHPIPGRIMELLLTSDGKTLIVGDDSGKTIQLWDLAGKKKRHELKGQRGIPGSLALSPDGKTLATESEKDRQDHVWDVATGQEKFRLTTTGGLRSVAFSPDGKTLVTTGYDVHGGGCLRFWDVATGNKLREQRTLHPPLNFAYSPDGKLLAGREDDFRLHVYDAASGQHLRSFDAALNTYNGPIFSPDSKIIATHCNSTQAVHLLDAASGKPLHSDRGHRSTITGLVFSADGKTLYSAAGFATTNGIYLWDAATGEPRGQLGDERLGRAMGLALSPDGSSLAACGLGDYSIRLWDVASRKEVRAFKRHTGFVDYLAWSANGKLLASSSNDDKAIRLWDVASGKPRGVIEAKLEGIGNIDLSPDGKIVAAGSYQDGTIHLWSADTGKELLSIATSQNNNFALAFSPDGSILASGGMSSGIHLWDVATGRLRQRWGDDQSWIARLAFCAMEGRWFRGTAIAPGEACRRCVCGKWRRARNGPVSWGIAVPSTVWPSPATAAASPPAATIRPSSSGMQPAGRVPIPR